MKVYVRTGMKIYTNELGRMTKIAAMPTYMVKTFKNLLLQHQWTDGHETLYVAVGTQVLPRLFKMTLS